MEITQWQLKLAGGVQSNIHPSYCRLGVVAKNPKEWIKRCGRIRIQQRIAQARLAHHATSEIFLLVSGVTKAQFPIPTLEVIANLPELTAKSDVEEHVSESSSGCSDGGVVNAAEADPGSHRCAIRQSCVRHRDRIKRILYWHTDAERTEGITVRLLKWIRRERSSRQGCIKK